MFCRDQRHTEEVTSGGQVTAMVARSTKEDAASQNDKDNETEVDER